MTSLAFNNPKVQQLRRLIGRRSARREAAAFVIEGPTLLAEALAAGITVEAVFVSGDTPAELPGGIPVFHLAPGVFERVSDLDTPRGVVAIARKPLVAIGPDASFVVVAVGVADPGNAGTIVRSAEAAGADGVVFTPGSVDPFNPKSVRAAAGALFHVPVAVDADPRSLGLRLVASSARGGVPYTEADFIRPLALVFGNESHGLADALRPDETVSIPHAGRSESLNVAMAATVLCFEVARQRRLAR